MSEIYDGTRRAINFKRMADEKNVSDLNPLFEKIEEVAKSGKYDLDIKTELSEAQENALNALGFDIGSFDEDDDEYAEGFRTWITWDDPNDVD